jgi:predicted nuclease of predicted toxin-antitoxin system
MRLLIDENIPSSLSGLLPQWTIATVNDVKNNSRLTDYGLWQFARVNRYVIVTFDADFADIHNLLSFPPKVILLRDSKLTTKKIAATLTRLESQLNAFLTDNKLGVFEISA